MPLIRLNLYYSGSYWPIVKASIFWDGDAYFGKTQYIDAGFLLRTTTKILGLG